MKVEERTRFQIDRSKYSRCGNLSGLAGGESSGAADAAIVVTHMMLEADSIGLGTVRISYFDMEKARQLLELPENWEPMCMLYIGCPAADFQPTPHMTGKRYPLENTCFWNQVPQDRSISPVLKERV